MDMSVLYYTVEKIDGDYAVLALESEPKNTILMARALLPQEIDEGTRLRFDPSCFLYEIVP